MSSTDYSHHYHAGNVGDVWKHCALVSWLAALRRGAGVCCAIETHAGVGCYRLGSTGEWTEGIGKLATIEAELPPAVALYLERVRALGFGRRGQGATYPGSPLLELSLLGPADRAIFHELAEPARLALAENLEGEPRATVKGEDGLAALPGCLRSALDASAIRAVVIDPPYTAKEEWTDVPDALREAHRVDPAAHLFLWYPVKSLTRPEAMLRRIRADGVPATALELITTPLELKRNRLNGSGVLLVNPPPGTLAEIAAAAPALGAACATHQGRWFTRGLAWS